MSVSGYWKVDINIRDDDDNEIKPNDADLEHIAEMIKQGYTQGEIVHEE